MAHKLARANHTQLVEDTIRQINRTWQQGVLGAVVSVGDCAIKAFYGGDLDRARAFRATRPELIDELIARRHELVMGLNALKAAIKIAVQYHELPRNLADGLSKTHHVALLPVPDERKRLYAEQAVAHSLSVKEFEQRIREEYPRHAGGRKPSPASLRTVEASLRLLGDRALDKALSPSKLKEMSDKERSLLLAGAIQLREIGEKIEQQLLALARA